MKKRRKLLHRWVSMALTACMLLSALPVTAFAWPANDPDIPNASNVWPTFFSYYVDGKLVPAGDTRNIDETISWTGPMVKRSSDEEPVIRFYTNLKPEIMTDGTRFIDLGTLLDVILIVAGSAYLNIKKNDSKIYLAGGYTNAILRSYNESSLERKNESEDKFDVVVQLYDLVGKDKDVKDAYGYAGIKFATARFYDNEDNLLKETYAPYAVSKQNGSGEAAITPMATGNVTPPDLQTFGRIGYRVAGWSTQKNSAEKVNADTYWATKATNFYPAWEAVNDINVRFDTAQPGDDAPVCGETTRRLKYWAAYDDVNGDGKSDKPLPTPTCKGYAFKGWYTKDGKQVSDNLKNLNISDVTLYAHWEPKTYTVTLDQQSPTTPGADTQTTATFDSPLPALTEAVPEKTGYTFSGYYEQQNGGGKRLVTGTGHPTDSVWKKDEPNASVYAYWKPDTTELTLNANGGTGGAGKITAEYDKALPASTDKPQRTGYTFAGYYDAANGGVQYYDADGKCVYNAGGGTVWDKAKTSAIELFAHWSVDSYTVTLKSNGTEQFSQVVEYGKPLASVTPPVRAGYLFEGYFKSGDANPYINRDGGGVRAWEIAENSTLDAAWSAKTYSVTLNYQGGNLGGAETKSVSATYDAALPALTALLPTKTGSKFLGFWTQPGGKGVQYYDASGKPASGKSKWDIDEDAPVLYAAWNQTPYELNLDFNLPTGSTESDLIYAGDKKFTVYYNQAYPEDLANEPKLTGYTFGGWYTNASCLPVDLVQPGVSLVPAQESITLHALWTPREVKVYFRVLEGLTTYKTYKYGSVYAAFPTIQPSGMELDGWYTKPEGAGDKIVEGTSQVLREEDHTLYPNYKAKNVEISFDTSGIAVNETLNPINTVFGGKYGSLPSPTDQSGAKTFGGWYLESTFLTAVDADTEVRNAQAHKLYAKWVQGQALVSFNLNGGDGAYPARTYDANTTYESQGELPEPTRYGYTFDGWFKDNNTWSEAARNDDVVSDKAGTAADNKITLHAKWVPKKVQVTFVTTNGTLDGSAAEKKVVCDFDGTYDSAYGGTLPTNLTDATGAYRFTGWTVGLFGDMIAGSSKIADEGPLTVTANWESQQATVVLNANQGVLTETAGIKVANTVNVGSSLDLSKAVISRDSFAFGGWNTKPDGTGASVTGEFKPSSAGITVLYAVWTEIPGKYCVSHYREALDGSYPANPSEQEAAAEAAANEVVSAEPKELSGSYEGYHLDYSNVNAAPSGIVPSGGTLELKLFYARNQHPVTILPADSFTVSAVENESAGKVSGDSGNAYVLRHGGKLAFQVNAAAGYDPATVKVTVNGVELKKASGQAYYLLENVTESKTVGISIDRTNLQVRKPQVDAGNAGYALSPVGGSFEVPYGKDFSFTVLLDTSHTQSDVQMTVTRAGGSSPEVLQPVGGVYTVENVTTEVTLTASGLRWNRYRMNLGAGVGYTLSSSASPVVQYGGDYAFRLALDEAYAGAVPVVRANGAELRAGSVTDERIFEYTLSGVTDFTNITVEPLEKPVYTVALPEGTGYEIVPVDNMPGTVGRGASFSFRINLGAAYRYLQPVVTVTGANGGTETLSAFDGVYTVGNITENKQIHVANVTDDTYSVTIAEGAGYEVGLYSEENTVGYGGSYIFAIGVDEAYAGKEPIVCGNGTQLEPVTQIDTSYAYQIENITENVLVTVNGLEAVGQQIKWVVDGVSTYSYCPNDTVPSYGGTPSKPADAEYSYAFLGWRAQDGTLYSAGSNLPKVTSAATYTAVFEQTRNQYEVQWVIDGTVTKEMCDYGVVPTHTPPVKEKDAYFQYTFTGWSDGTQTHAGTLPKVVGPATYTAQFAPAAREYQLTVHYIYASDQQSAAEDAVQSFAAGSEYSITSPSIDQHFASRADVSGVMPARDEEITVMYYPSADTPYTVTHRFPKLGGDGYEDVVETRTGTAGSMTNAAPMVVEGFTAGEVANTPIAADTNIEITYARKRHTVTWIVEGVESAQEYAYGEPLVVPQTPSKEQDDAYTYVFSGWNQAVPAAMPDADLRFTAQFSPEARAYTLTVKFQDMSGKPVGMNTAEISRQYKVGEHYSVSGFPEISGMKASVTQVSGIMPSQDVERIVRYYSSSAGVVYRVDHYLANADGTYPDEPYESTYAAGEAGKETNESGGTYNGYTVEAVGNKTASADGTTVVDIKYRRNSYTVTFEPNGGTAAGQTSFTGAWGTAITAPSMTRPGMAFDGWQPSFNGKIPLGGGSFTAQWKSGGSGGGTGGGSGGSSGGGSGGNSGGGSGGNSGGGSGGNSGGGTSIDPNNPNGGKPYPDEIECTPLTPCDGGESCVTRHLEDNPFGKWYHHYVDYAYQNNLMVGVTAERFAPDEELTRAMLVTTLYRMSGQPSADETSAYTDVPDGQWFSAPIIWATQADIVSGYGYDRFGPDDPVTREQAAAILFRFARLHGRDMDGRAQLETYADAETVSSWARDAVAWAVESELLNGRAGNVLDPAGTATRAEIAAILTRFCTAGQQSNQ